MNKLKADLIDDIKFQVGDKLKASDFDRSNYGIKFVIITSINLTNKVYHWEANFQGGKIHSGYFFNEAKKYSNKKK